MNRDDIIRMAREVGLLFDNTLRAPTPRITQKQKDIIRFANLVAAAERERIISANAPEIERINEYIKTLEEAVAAEREACAQMAGNYAAANAESDNMAWAFLHLATAIRARGEK